MWYCINALKYRLQMRWGLMSWSQFRKRWFFGFRCWCQLSLLPTCCIAGEYALMGGYDKRQVTHWGSQFPVYGFSFKTDPYGLQTWWLVCGPLSRRLKIEVREHFYLNSSWKGREKSHYNGFIASCLFCLVVAYFAFFLLVFQVLFVVWSKSPPLMRITLSTSILP